MDRPNASRLSPPLSLPFFFPRLPLAMRWLLAAAVALHVLAGAALGLSVDEAHYALYARHPALSYFDHPPLVGWIQWPMVALGASDAALRCIPAVLWLATVWLVHGVARQLQESLAAPNDEARGDAGAWAVVALLLSPILHVLGISLLPDTLLMSLGMAVMALTLRMVRGASGPTPTDWMVLGALLGLAGLSKYTAVLIVPAVTVILVSAHGLRMLRTPWPWVALGIALLAIAPVLVWNAQNGWISFRYQLAHGGGDAWRPGNVARFALVQVVAYGPMLACGVAGLLMVGRRFRQFGLFWAVPLAVFITISGGGSALPHWTAPAWVALAPFAGVALAASMPAGLRIGVWGLGLAQALVCAGLLALMLAGGMPFFAGRTASAESTDPPNPFADLHGWDQAGARARALAAAQGLTSVSVQNWTLASRIGWYARPLPVHVLQDRFDQFDLWAGKLPVGGDTLLVDWSQQPYVTPLGAHGFARCDALDSLEVRRLGFSMARFDFYACRGWSGDPKPVLKPAAGGKP